jgi:hypothetical protein
MSASRLVVPASLQDRTSICCLRPEEPSQMIEFVFSASPETNRRGPRDVIPRPVGNRQDLAACAFMNPDICAFPLLGKLSTLPKCA